MKSWLAKGTSQNPGNAFCSFSLWKLGSGYSLLNTRFLFLVTTESCLVECFLCQATAEPIFIILEISMSHKINPQPTVSSMGVSFLELFKIKEKRLNLESHTRFYQTILLSPTWRILLYFKAIQAVLPEAPFHPNSPDPSPLQGTRPGLQRKEAIWRFEGGSDSLAQEVGGEVFPQEPEYKWTSDSFPFPNGKSCEGTTS